MKTFKLLFKVTFTFFDNKNKFFTCRDYCLESAKYEIYLISFRLYKLTNHHWLEILLCLFHPLLLPFDDSFKIINMLLGVYYFLKNVK